MYDSVLVPTDGSQGSERAIHHGLGLARVLDADLHALYVVDERRQAGAGDELRAEVRETDERAGRSATEAVAERGESAGVDVVRAVESGVPHRAIVAYADDHDVDLVVMGTHGRTGRERHLLGSTAERVVRLSPVPVMTVRMDEDALAAESGEPVALYEDVLVPTDGSDPAADAAEHAVDLADAYDASIHALYVVDTSTYELEQLPGSVRGLLREGGRGALDDVTALAEDAGVPVSAELREGVPASVVLDHAAENDVDLVVMGARGRTGLPERLLGGTTDRVLRQAVPPVLVAR